MGPGPEWAARSGAVELARWTLTMNLGSGNQGTQVRLGHRLHVATQGEEGAREQGECKARGDSKLLNVGTSEGEGAEPQGGFVRLVGYPDVHAQTHT